MEDKPLGSTSVLTPTNFSVETKQAFTPPPQETKLPYYQHSESTPVSQSEQALLEHLNTVLVQNDVTLIHEALETFIERLQADTLSQPAIHRLANHCYRYWEQHLPTNQMIATTTKAINRYKNQWRELAKGRLLYREITSHAGMQQIHYYWSSSNTAELPAKPGAFYLCHPAFDYPPVPATRSIAGAEEIQDPILLNNLTQHEQAEQLLRRQTQISNQIVQFSTALQRIATPHDQQISDYRIASLLLQRGYIESIPNDDPQKHAPFYAARLLSTQALEQWRQQLPEVKAQEGEITHNTSLQTCAVALRNALDQALLWQAYCNQLKEQHSDTHLLNLSTFYTLNQRAFGLLENYLSIFPGQLHALLEQLTESLNEDDHDDRYRIAVRQALTTTCRWPATPTDWSIEQLTQAITTLADTWRQYGKTALANAQIRFYRQILRESRNKLAQQEQAGLFAEEEAQYWHRGTTASLTKALIMTEPTTQPITSRPALILPKSQWSSRDQLLATWHRNSGRLLRQNAAATALYQENTHTAQQLMQNLCEETEQQLGTPPTTFTILGLGSYSRGETSFASDLDFAILIADARAKGSTYFAAFLDCLAYKASGFPHGILPLEAKELRPMKIGECWVGTPEEFMEEHCYLPTSEKAAGGLSDRSYPLLRPKPLYFTTQQPKAAEQLWLDYRQKLDDFFAQTDEDGRPYAHQTEPWYLQQHLKPDAALTLSSSTKPEKKEPTLTLQKTNLKAALYPLTHAILSWSRYTGYSLSVAVPPTHTATQAMLDHLAKARFLPPLFIEALRSALADLHRWRLRLHWDGLQYSYPTDLQEDEVWLWPTDPAAQKSLEKLPRGFYLNAAETEHLSTWRITLEGVILRGLQAFTELPFAAAELPAPKLPSLAEEKVSASFTSTSSSQKLESSTAENKSTVPLASTPQKVTFHPLAAAVEATLRQLNAPLRRNPSDVEEYHEMQWLAQVMVECAQHLFPIETQISDPQQVKENESLRCHWRIYWELPPRWRKLYIETLRQSPQADIREITEFLTKAPNQAGWRLHTRLQEDTWQISLRSLLAADPQPTLPESAKAGIKAGTAVWLSWVQNRTIVWAPLKPEYIAQLFADNAKEKLKTWRPAEHKGGNHRIYCLKVKGLPKIWLKLYPEQPSTELIVASLAHRLGCADTPAQQLVAIHHAPLLLKNGTVKGETISCSAALLSTHVAGPENGLHTILQKQPERLAQLDFLSFARRLLTVLLTNPEDDKDNDYFVVEVPDSKSSAPHYQLIRIDNERAFFPATRLQRGLVLQAEELQVKSILYCLDQMLTPWSQDARTAALLDELRQIQPAALVSDLLNELAQLHPLWQQLFSEHAVKQHARCQDPWLSLPVLMVPEGLETTLLKRLTALQVALRSLPLEAITGLKLLSVSQRQLAHYYQKAFAAQPPSRDKPHAHVSARFEAVAGAYYRGANKASDHRISQLSGPMVLSRQLSLTLPELPQTQQDQEAYIAFACAVHEQKAHSALQALENIQHWQHVDAERVKKGLLQLKPEAAVQFFLLPTRTQQMILEQLLEPKQLERQPLSEAQQNFLLTVLNEAQCHNLNLTPFKTVLTNKQLEAIVKNAGQKIIALDISGCTRLTADILRTIQYHCPHLHYLRANQQNQWRSIDISDFVELVNFECEQATSLTQLTLRNLPQLRRLSIAGASALKNLADQGWGITSSLEHWTLPKLQDLNVENCTQLISIQIKLNTPANLKCIGKPKDQLTLLSLLRHRFEDVTKRLFIMARGGYLTYAMGDYLRYWNREFSDFNQAAHIGRPGLARVENFWKKININNEIVLLTIMAYGYFEELETNKNILSRTKAFLILLEITPQEKFKEEAASHIKSIQALGLGQVPIILIGVETHLREALDEHKCISHKEAEAFAKQKGADAYFEYTHKEPLEKFDDIMLQCGKMACSAKNRLEASSLTTPSSDNTPQQEHKKSVPLASYTKTSPATTLPAPHTQSLSPTPKPASQATTPKKEDTKAKNEKEILKIVVRGSGGIYAMEDYFEYWLSGGTFKIESSYQIPVGSNFVMKTLSINNKQIKLQIWLIGSRESSSRAKPFIKNGNGFLILSEVASKYEKSSDDVASGFKESAIDLIRQSKTYGYDEAPVVLVGVNAHLRQHPRGSRNCISYEEAREFAEQEGADAYFEYTYKEPLEKLDDIILQCAKKAYLNSGLASKGIDANSLTVSFSKDDKLLERKETTPPASHTKTSSTTTLPAPHAQFFSSTSMPATSQTTTPKVTPPENKTHPLLTTARALLNEERTRSLKDSDAYKAYDSQLTELEQHADSLSSEEMESLRGICKTLGMH